MAAGPVSRILSATRMLRDGHSSGPRITARLKRPTRRLWRAEPARIPSPPEGSPENPSLFGLAPCGVCPARDITAAAVRSYRTFSPLPRPAKAEAVCFLWHFPSNDEVPTLRKEHEGWATQHPPGRYPAHCSAEFGLSSRPVRRRGERPSGPAAYKIIICEGPGLPAAGFRLPEPIALSQRMLRWADKLESDRKVASPEAHAESR